MSSPADWFNSLPKVTRFYLSGTASAALSSCEADPAPLRRHGKPDAPPTRCPVAAAGAFLSTASCQLGLLSPQQLFLSLPLVIRELEFWRLLTNLLFFGMFGMPFVFNLFFLVRYSQQLEESRFAGKSADYVWCLVYCAFWLTLASLVLEGQLPFLAPALLSSIVYLWSRMNPMQQLSVFGLFTVQAFYFPWVLVMITVLMGGSPVTNIAGILAGHAYYFASDVMHVTLSAPSFLCVGSSCLGASLEEGHLIWRMPTHPCARVASLLRRRDLFDDAPRPVEANRRGAFGGYNWGHGGQRLGD